MFDYAVKHKLNTLVCETTYTDITQINTLKSVLEHVMLNNPDKVLKIIIMATREHIELKTECSNIIIEQV